MQLSPITSCKKEKSNLLTAVRNSILIKPDFQSWVVLAFLLLLYANPCSKTHDWTSTFKNFHLLVSLASLPNILEAIS